jgi:hypothetical protein
MDKPMTIRQALRALDCKNEHQLSRKIGVSYQAIQYWRKKMDGKLPHPWPAVVRSLAP